MNDPKRLASDVLHWSPVTATLPRALATLALSLALGCAFAPARAAACSCVEWPPEKRFAEASEVFLGTYHRPAEDDDGGTSRFDVMHSFKGSAGNVFQLPRQAELDCERSFNNKELALVIVVKGRIPICAGNFDIDKMMPTLGEYFTLSGHNSDTPSMDAIKLALTGKLGRSKKVKLYSPTLAGKSLQVGSTRVDFVDAKGEELFALSAVTSGQVSYVSFRTTSEIATWFLVAPVKGKLAIAYQLQRDLKIK